MIINDLFNNKKFVAEEESEAESERRRYPNYYQHKDRGTVFKVQSPDGKTKTVPPDDEKWDDYYQKKFKGMPTPNDGGFWSDDDTAAMVEGSAGQVVFSGTGADGGKYEIIQSSPTDFMIHANGKHIDTYGSLQRAMSVLQNEVPGLQQGMAEGWKDKAAAAALVGTALASNAVYQDGVKVSVDDANKLRQTTLSQYKKDKKDLKKHKADLDKTNAYIKKESVAEGLPQTLRKVVPGYAKREIDKKMDAEKFGRTDVDRDANYYRYKKIQDKLKEQGVAEQAPPINVPPGQQATTQPDGSTRISKPGSVSRADYAKNMAAYKAQTQTPENIADFKQRMASGQGYADTERQANLQQQQQHFGKYADTGDLDEQGMAEGWRDIYNLNKQKIGTNPNLIKPDTVLKMPDGSRYKVKPGDNLSSIAKISGAKSAQPSTSTSSKAAVVPKYYSLPPDAAAAVKPAPVKPAAAHDDSPYIFDPRSGQGGVKPDRIADVFQNPKLPPPLTRDEIEQQMMQPDFGGPNAPGYKHTVQGAEGEEYEFDSGQEAKDFVDRIEQLRLRDRALGGLGAAKSESISSKKKGMAEDDGFDVVSNYQNMRTTDTGNKSNQTYTGTTIAKNPATGQQKSLASWDHTDPKTGKNYSGSNYIDAQGNAEVQKNYEESKNKVNEVSLGDYRKKATMNKAMAQTNKFFGRDDPAAVAAADRTIAKRERGLGRADARRRPYTAPPVDQDKQRRDLADKYPNIDELVRQAELRRDPQYDRAEGNAYYAGRDAEHNYHRLKQIQRMIRGAELDEMNFGGVNQTTDSATGDITTNFNQGPMSVSQTKTPGGYTKQTDQQFNLGTATLGARTVGPNIGAGQLAGTTTKTATNNMTGQAKQQVKGVGFGGASGATVGKNYVGASDDELAKVAADSVTGINEEPNQATVNVPGQTPPVNKTNQSKSPSMYDIDKANRKEIASQFDPKSTYVNPYDKNTKALDKGSKAINTMADFEESIDHELAKYAVDSATGINEEPNQATLNVPGASFTADKNTNTLSGTTNVHGVDLTATRNLTPGGARTFSASTNVAPNLNMTATQKSADYTKGQLAGTKAVSANYTDTAGALGKPGQQHTATRTAGVGFGGATGAKVGKNYVDQYSVNESLERMQHLAGIKQSRV